jgi:hypothetical protein
MGIVSRPAGTDAYQQKIAAPLPEFTWPHNHDAERAVLGESLLLGIDCFRAARAHCEPADFFFDAHREIFAAMDALAEAGAAIDCLIVYERLEKSEALKSLGGLAYLGTLKTSETEATNVIHYARIVAEKARMRQVMNVAAVLYARASAEDQTPAELVSDGEKLLAGIAASNGARGFVDLFDTPEELASATPLTFAIKDFLQKDAATVIAGLVGSYKTFVSLSIAKALLNESETLWSTFPVLHKAESVIYLIPESARGPFCTRLELIGLMPYVHNHRLLVRTLNKGPVLALQDARFLGGIRGAHVFVDTGIRFMAGSENEAGDAARGLSADILAMIANGAASVVVLLHSPKSFETQNYMTLENMVRGSGELGAPFATGWGVRHLPGDIVHVQNIKPRDFEPRGPFQLAARPYIDTTGDFFLWKAPGDCGTLVEEMPDTNRNNGGGAPQVVRDARNANLALLSGFLKGDPNLNSRQIVQKFRELQISVSDSAIRKYRKELGV